MGVLGLRNPFVKVGFSRTYLLKRFVKVPRTFFLKLQYLAYSSKYDLKTKMTLGSSWAFMDLRYRRGQTLLLDFSKGYLR